MWLKRAGLGRRALVGGCTKMDQPRHTGSTSCVYCITALILSASFPCFSLLARLYGPQLFSSSQQWLYTFLHQVWARSSFFLNHQPAMQLRESRMKYMWIMQPGCQRWTAVRIMFSSSLCLPNYSWLVMVPVSSGALSRDFWEPQKHVRKRMELISWTFLLLYSAQQAASDRCFCF